MMLRFKRQLRSILFLLIFIPSFSTNCESSKNQEYQAAKRAHSRSPSSNSPSPQLPPSPSEWSLYVQPESSSHSSKRLSRSRSTVEEVNWQNEENASKRSEGWFNEFLQRADSMFTSVAIISDKFQEYEEKKKSAVLNTEVKEKNILGIENRIKSDISYFVRWEELKREDVRIGITPTSSPHPLLEQCSFTVFIEIAMEIGNRELTMNPKDDKVPALRDHELFKNQGCGTFLHIKSKTTDFEEIKTWFIINLFSNYVAALIINFNVLKQTVNVFGVGLGGNVASKSMDAFRKFSATVPLIKFNLTALNPMYTVNFVERRIKFPLGGGSGGHIVEYFENKFDKVTLIFTTNFVPRTAGSPNYLKIYVRGCIDTVNIFLNTSGYIPRFKNIFTEEKRNVETEHTGFIDVTLELPTINLTIETYRKSLAKSKEKDLSSLLVL